MVSTNKLKRNGLEIERLLRMESRVLGVKMVESESQIPRNAKRPVKDFGHHLSFCQTLSLARRQGMTIAQTKSDMWCFEPVIGLGFQEPPVDFLSGHNKYPEATKSLHAGAVWAKNMVRFDVGLYKGVVVGPMSDISFYPDILVVYADPARMSQITIAKNYLDGINISPTLSGHAACLYYVVPPIKEKIWNISLPCGGDLRRAACEPHTMVFSAPIEVLEDLLEALKEIENKGIGLPLHLSMAVEYALPESYVTIGRKMGMDWVK